MSTTQDLYLHYLPTHDAAAADLIGQTLDDGISLRTQRTPMGRQWDANGTLRDELDEHADAQAFENKGSTDTDEHGKSAPPGIRTQDESL